MLSKGKMLKIKKIVNDFFFKWFSERILKHMDKVIPVHGHEGKDYTYNLISIPSIITHIYSKNILIW